MSISQQALENGMIQGKIHLIFTPERKDTAKTERSTSFLSQKEKRYGEK